MGKCSEVDSTRRDRLLASNSNGVKMTATGTYSDESNAKSGLQNLQKETKMTNLKAAAQQAGHSLDVEDKTDVNQKINECDKNTCEATAKAQNEEAAAAEGATNRLYPAAIATTLAVVFAAL